MTEMVPLSKIKDNPHRDKKRNPIDKAKVEALVESIGTTGFWKGIYGRKKGGFVEIAYGHNRVEAARATGLKEIPIEIEELTDSDMLMRMTRENLRGELLVALEAVSAAVKAFGAGIVNFAEIPPKTKKSTLLYAPSFIPGKASSTSGVDHPYTADSLARFLGGTYVKHGDNSAQNLVVAALGILEMEERKSKKFSEKMLEVNGVGPDGKYIGAKRIIKIISEVKQTEIKDEEDAKKTDEQKRRDNEAKEKINKDKKEREAAAKKEHDELLRKQMEAIVEENAKKAKQIAERIRKDAEKAEWKAAEDEAKLLALEGGIEARRKAAEEQRKVDEYLPVRRETDRIIHILERRDLAEDLKALARRPLNAQDRERVRQAALNASAWYGDWVAMQFIPPNTTRKKEKK